MKPIMACFPDHWVLRHQTERDYGVDCIVEMAEMATPQRPGAEMPGELFAIQSKGVAKVTWRGSNDARWLRVAGIKKSTVYYWMKLPFPVFH
jgi:hypothetical protein